MSHYDDDFSSLPLTPGTRAGDFTGIPVPRYQTRELRMPDNHMKKRLPHRYSCENMVSYIRQIVEQASENYPGILDEFYTGSNFELIVPNQGDSLLIGARHASPAWRELGVTRLLVMGHYYYIGDQIFGDPGFQLGDNGYPVGMEYLDQGEQHAMPCTEDHVSEIHVIARNLPVVYSHAQKFLRLCQMYDYKYLAMSDYKNLGGDSLARFRNSTTEISG